MLCSGSIDARLSTLILDTITADDKEIDDSFFSFSNEDYSEALKRMELKKYGADLALCGHTHAGQIFPGNLIVPFFNENAYGYKEVGGLDTIVTSGVGYYGPPMRVGTDSEVAVVHLHFKKG